MLILEQHAKQHTDRKSAVGRIGVENSDYHQQSQCEIGGGKRIYQHL
jgi:hypothetical protein